MRTAPAAWDTYNVSESKPRFIFDLGLTDDYVSGEFSGRAAGTQKLFAGTPKLTLTEINPLRPQLKFLGTAVIQVQDNGNAITTLISANTLLGRTVTIKYGFEDNTEAEFQDYFKGRIVDYTLGADMINYTFRIENSFFDVDKMAFTGISQTELAEQMSGAEFSLVATNNPAAGSSVDIVLPYMDPNIAVNDALYVSGGGNDEIFIIENIDPSANTIVATTLANSYTTPTVDTQRIPIDSVTNFPSAVPSNPPFQDGLAVLIDQEIVRYTSKHVANNWLIMDSIRNSTLFDTVSSQHRDDATVRECWIIRDDPMTLMLNVLTTSDGTNGSYDLNIGGFGIAMDEDLIDGGAFEAIRDEYFSSAGDELRYFITEPMNAMDFCIDVAKAAGCYFVVTHDGLLSVKKITRVNPGMSLASLTQADLAIDEDGSLRGFNWGSGANDLINEIEYKYDWVPGLNLYKTVRTFELATSKTTYNRNGRLTIESKGMRRWMAGVDSAFVNVNNSILANRYANPPPKLDIDIDITNAKIEAGDIVDLTSSIIPDIEAGDRTLAAELIECLKSEIDFNENVIHFSGYMYRQENAVSIGNSDTATTVADDTATFDATDSTAVDANDAYFDNSADLGGISGTRAILVVKISLDQDTPGDGAQTVGYHMRVGTISGGTMTVVTDDLDFTHNWIAGKYGGLGHVWFNIHTFDGLASSAYDALLDYHTRTGTDGSSIADITLVSVTIETDGAAYTELT